MSTHDILFVDTVGHLADLYQWADLSYVGGSFSRGVHSVMESLVWGAPTLVGPVSDKNSEVKKFSQLDLKTPEQENLNLKAVTIIKNSDDLLTQAKLYSENWNKTAKESLLKAFHQGTGASQGVAQWLLNPEKHK